MLPALHHSSSQASGLLYLSDSALTMALPWILQWHFGALYKPCRVRELKVVVGNQDQPAPAEEGAACAVTGASPLCGGAAALVSSVTDCSGGSCALLAALMS